jgi:hypothetical protein
MRWFYTGSHNMSKAAWGELQFSPGRGQQLFARSFELGVLALPSFVATAADGAAGVLLAPGYCVDEAAAPAAAGAPRVVGVPVPFALPPRRRFGFAPGDVADHPWTWDPAKITDAALRLRVCEGMGFGKEEADADDGDGGAGGGGGGAWEDDF